MPTIDALPLLPSALNTDRIPVLQGGTVYVGTRAQIVAATTDNLQNQITSNDADITALQSGKLNLSGGTMVGALTLFGTPESDLHASTRLYVDTLVNLRLRLSGGTLTGFLTLNADPTNPLHAASRQFVLSAARDECIRELENYNPVTTGAYPITYDSATISAGAAYYITVAGTISITGTAVVLAIGDILIARVDSATNAHADWAILNGNIVDASTTVSGISELATDAEALAKVSSTVVLTPSNLASGNMQASATVEGLTEHATDIEYLAAALTTRSITPSNLAASITDFQQFVGTSNIILTTSGTWTQTVSAVAGDVFSRRTAAAATPIISFDITPQIRIAASRGFSLTSFDYIYKIGTADLVAHTLALYTFNYTDDSATTPTVSTPAITGTLITAFGANIRATNISVNVPAFLITSISKHVINITANCAATSILDIYGINLKFSRTTI